jgi:hypothetical protein
MRISRISAGEVVDSRGNPTVEASVILEDGATARRSCQRELRYQARFAGGEAFQRGLSGSVIPGRSIAASIRNQSEGTAQWSR